MNPNLQFEFTVNKENKTIVIKREFNAGLALVWDAWTKPEFLDLWWAPKPYRNKTISMNFSVGGAWLYAMYSPENVAHWCRADYKHIEPHVSFSGLDAFCNEEGVVTEAFPNSLWNNTFIHKGESTIIDITITYNSLENLQKVIEMGFKEGFTMAMKNLDECLAAKQIH